MDSCMSPYQAAKELALPAEWSAPEAWVHAQVMVRTGSSEETAGVSLLLSVYFLRLQAYV